MRGCRLLLVKWCCWGFWWRCFYLSRCMCFYERCCKLNITYSLDSGIWSVAYAGVVFSKLILLLLTNSIQWCSIILMLMYLLLCSISVSLGWLLANLLFLPRGFEWHMIVGAFDKFLRRGFCSFPLLLCSVLLLIFVTHIPLINKTRKLSINNYEKFSISRKHKILIIC